MSYIAKDLQTIRGWLDADTPPDARSALDRIEAEHEHFKRLLAQNLKDYQEKEARVQELEGWQEREVNARLAAEARVRELEERWKKIEFYRRVVRELAETEEA